MKITMVNSYKDITVIVDNEDTNEIVDTLKGMLELHGYGGLDRFFYEEDGLSMEDSIASMDKSITIERLQEENRTLQNVIRIQKAEITAYHKQTNVTSWDEVFDKNTQGQNQCRQCEYFASGVPCEKYIKAGDDTCLNYSKASDTHWHVGKGFAHG